MLPSGLLIELTCRCLQMHKPYSGREAVFDPGALLAPMEEMSAVAGLKEPEDKAMPHHDCSRHTTPAALSYMWVTAVNILCGAEEGSVLSQLSHKATASFVHHTTLGSFKED